MQVRVPERGGSAVGWRPEELPQLELLGPHDSFLDQLMCGAQRSGRVAGAVRISQSPKVEVMTAAETAVVVVVAKGSLEDKVVTLRWRRQNFEVHRRHIGTLVKRPRRQSL